MVEDVQPAARPDDMEPAPARRGGTATLLDRIRRLGATTDGTAAEDGLTDVVDRVAELQQGPTVLECTVKFRRELRNRQQVVVRSEVVSYVGKIARIRQEIVLPTGEAACEAEFVVGLFDLARRKLIEPTAAWLESVGLSQDDWRPQANERGPRPQ